MADDDDFGDLGSDLGGPEDELEEDGFVDETGEAVRFDPKRTVAKEEKTLQYLYAQHPETKLLYVEQIDEKLPLASYPPENDKNHRSYPFLTLYEKTKIIGFRANQIAQGSQPFVKVPDDVTDCADIARLELEAKRLPFIVARPMPDGTFEYWRLTDLMLL